MAYHSADQPQKRGKTTMANTPPTIPSRHGAPGPGGGPRQQPGRSPCQGAAEAPKRTTTTSSPPCAPKPPTSRTGCCGRTPRWRTSASGANARRRRRPSTPSPAGAGHRQRRRQLPARHRRGTAGRRRARSGPQELPGRRDADRARAAQRAGAPRHPARAGRRTSRSTRTCIRPSWRCSAPTCRRHRRAGVPGRLHDRGSRPAPGHGRRRQRRPQTPAVL